MLCSALFPTPEALCYFTLGSQSTKNQRKWRTAMGRQLAELRRGRPLVTHMGGQDGRKAGERLTKEFCSMVMPVLLGGCQVRRASGRPITREADFGTG